MKVEFTNLPVNAIVRLPHPQSGDSHGQEAFLAPSAVKQTYNYDLECSNHYLMLSKVTTTLLFNYDYDDFAP